MTTWVLLRGLARESGHWGDFPARLSARLGSAATVVAVDLPGNGSLHAQASPITVKGNVASARETLRRLGHQPPYVLLALSMGAMAAIQWAHEAPDELAGCVLVNTSVRGHGSFWQRLRPARYPTLLAMLLPWQKAARRELAVLSMTSEHPSRHGGVVRQWAELAQQHPVSAVNAARQLLAAARYRPPRLRPAVPMLVLASAGDRLVSSTCSHRLAQAWDLPLEVHPDAGHDLPLDDPAWVVALLGKWPRP
ncbi:MAG: alpha/beta hydrolase [Comamonadaceae bacterium]|nr:MAG: alpha/beta hydrolase [Comamonadaceae bacterium]